MISNNFDSLSDELILNTFMCLSAKDLLNCMSVCERWKQLSRDNSLWKSIKLFNQEIEDYESYKFYSSYSLRFKHIVPREIPYRKLLEGIPKHYLPSVPICVGEYFLILCMNSSTEKYIVKISNLRNSNLDLITVPCSYNDRVKMFSLDDSHVMLFYGNTVRVLDLSNGFYVEEFFTIKNIRYATVHEDIIYILGDDNRIDAWQWKRNIKKEEFFKDDDKQQMIQFKIQANNLVGRYDNLIKIFDTDKKELIKIREDEGEYFVKFENNYLFIGGPETRVLETKTFKHLQGFSTGHIQSNNCCICDNVVVISSTNWVFLWNINKSISVSNNPNISEPLKLIHFFNSKILGYNIIGDVYMIDVSTGKIDSILDAPTKELTHVYYSNHLYVRISKDKMQIWDLKSYPKIHSIVKPAFKSRLRSKLLSILPGKHHQ